MTNQVGIKIGLGVTLFCSLVFGTVAPDFQGKLAESPKKASLDSFVKEDRFLLISFWATWCVPCLKELGEITESMKKHPTTPLDVVTINVDQETQNEVVPTIRKLRQRTGFSYPVVLDPSQEIFGRYQQSRVPPYSVLVDSKKNIVKAFSGYNAELFAEIQKEIAARSQKKGS